MNTKMDLEVRCLSEPLVVDFACKRPVAMQTQMDIECVQLAERLCADVAFEVLSVLPLLSVR